MLKHQYLSEQCDLDCGLQIQISRAHVTTDTRIAAKQVED